MWKGLGAHTSQNPRMRSPHNTARATGVKAGKRRHFLQAQTAWGEQEIQSGTVSAWMPAAMGRIMIPKRGNAPFPGTREYAASHSKGTLRMWLCSGSWEEIILDYSSGPSVITRVLIGTGGKESACQCRRHKRHWFDPWVGKIPWRRARKPTPVFLPGESRGQSSLAGYSPQGRKESDMTEYACLQEEGRNIRVGENWRFRPRRWRKGLEEKAASRSWKGKEMDHPLEVQEEWGPLNTVILTWWKPYWTPDL